MSRWSSNFACGSWSRSFLHSQVFTPPTNHTPSKDAVKQSTLEQPTTIRIQRPVFRIHVTCAPKNDLDSNVQMSLGENGSKLVTEVGAVPMFIFIFPPKSAKSLSREELVQQTNHHAPPLPSPTLFQPHCDPIVEVVKASRSFGPKLRRQAHKQAIANGLRQGVRHYL